MKSFTTSFILSIASCVERVGHKFVRLSSHLRFGKRLRSLDEWFQRRGDITLRLDYSLDQDSIVWDVGGYEGQWASDIYARFGCVIHIFEPSPASADFIAKRFCRNPRIIVHPYALGASNERRSLSLSADSSSLEITLKDGIGVEVASHSVLSVWKSCGSPRIDLMKLNIEGAEYVLLDIIIATGMISHIVNLQVQFHDFIPDAPAWREKIINELSRTHVRTWCHEFVWENWTRTSA